ncbi:MerR-like DNA binding protein [Ancylobacter aquaticus]|uniref:MerR-like DNA binding protein n=1 Tax=Ancylobacter aquaticus TaxID=100 RepID=A0A4R1I5S9_ANCAQ|nr:MerR family transcriptional regulator [Ancylobacter aquaticus]TCK27989.1 MerR-like DNA binding protein [Ancylobacter aquaticus]
MPFDWRLDRAFAQAEAADLAGIHLSTLRVWMCEGAADLASERKRGRRWFSAHDILILRLAHELVRGGYVILTALAAAFELVDQIQASDVIIARNGGIATSQVRLVKGASLADLGGSSFIFIPASTIADATYAACRRAYFPEESHVAL